MCNRKKQSLKMIPAFLVSVIIIISGVLKISGHHPLLPHFAEMGFAGYVPLFGGLEIVFALLFLFPKTVNLGLLLLTAYFGGAMAVELSHGQLFVVPGIILSIIWLSAYLRDPGMFIFSARKGNAVKSLWME